MSLHVCLCMSARVHDIEGEGLKKVLGEGGQIETMEGRGYRERGQRDSIYRMTERQSTQREHIGTLQIERERESDATDRAIEKERYTDRERDTYIYIYTYIHA